MRWDQREKRKCLLTSLLTFPSQKGNKIAQVIRGVWLHHNLCRFSTSSPSLPSELYGTSFLSFWVRLPNSPWMTHHDSAIQTHQKEQPNTAKTDLIRNTYFLPCFVLVCVCRSRCASKKWKNQRQRHLSDPVSYWLIPPNSSSRRKVHFSISWSNLTIKKKDGRGMSESSGSRDSAVRRKREWVRGDPLLAGRTWQAKVGSLCIIADFTHQNTSQKQSFSFSFPTHTQMKKKVSTEAWIHKEG